MLPIVILDYRVLVFNILHKLDSIPARNEVLTGFNTLSMSDTDLQQIYLDNCWPYVFNRGPDTINLSEFTLVVVDDYKQPTHTLDAEVRDRIANSKFQPEAVYWRNLYYPEYKGGRSDKPASYNSVLSHGYDYCKNSKFPGFYLSKMLYEADDWAGSIVAYKRLCQHTVSKGSTDPVINQIANREILLYTVDSDWLQLVGDGVTWHNTGPWLPRIRSSKEAVEWWNKKRENRRFPISHPSQIIDGKVLLGDKSDNLPPGSPRYLIDLTNPPKLFNLRIQEASLIHQVLTTDQNSVTLRHFQQAKHTLLSNQLPLPC